MSVITFNAASFLPGTYPALFRKFSLSFMLKFICNFLLVALLVLFSLVCPHSGFAQSKKSKEKLGMIRVKPESFTRKKQRETASFTGRGYNRGGAQSVQRSKQREASNFVGTTVKVNRGNSNRTGNLAEASAYRNVKPPKQGRNPMGEQIARQSQAYRVNGLVKSEYKKRKEARRKSKQISSFRGNQVRSRYSKGKLARSKSEQMSRYRGDLIVTKRPKGAHPSAVYRGGKVKNSYQQKEKYRKRMMKRIGKNRNSQQPNYLRKKNRDEKPTYDSRESEIWSKPR
jgi:hypothetical protein